ncbi:MAG: SusC/RagA family TonB-linked outer membrane protein, partial [Bacteroidota bacterium]|nr:SusC/RagA family TonB-linked outer membrane protein [Bacteroidota bacterium]
MKRFKSKQNYSLKGISIDISLMKKVMAVILLIINVNTVSAKSYAQEVTFSLSFENISIKQALKEIEKQSDFYFMYNDNKIDVSKKIDIQVEEVSINQLLDQILKGTGIVYEIVDKQIVLNPKEIDTTSSGQIKTVKGTVVDESGSSLPGVNVFVKGTTIGTTTDLDGNYSLNIPGKESVLVFSFVGFKTIQRDIGKLTQINVTLIEESTKLDKIVVIGYGTSSKKLLTSSVANLKSEEIRETASGSVQSTLQGKTSGVQIVQNSGTPGGAISMKIRGASSLFSGMEPLYIVDGVPIIKGNYGQIGFEGQGIDAILDINPNDIESISVLKDASAASIYGSRAANGVVMITTKKGKTGESKISFRAYTGYQEEWKRLDLMNASEWKNYVSTFDSDFVANLDPNIDTDWQDEVFRTAPISNYELSFVGGDEKTQLYVSGGYFDQVGIVLGSEYEKYSGRVNVDHKLTEKLSVSARVGTNYSINNRVVGDQTINGVLPNAISKPPVYAVRDSVGNYLEEGFWDNPVAIGNEVTNEARTLRNISSLDIKYNILEGLSIKNQIGIDFYNLHERRYEPTTVDRGRESNGIGIDARSEVRSLSNQTTLDYIKTFKEVHDFTILLGTSFESENRSYSWIRASNFPSDDLEYITSAGNIEEASAIAYNDGLNSIFGRVKYNYQNKYIAEISYRRDGSSKFG